MYDGDKLIAKTSVTFENNLGTAILSVPSGNLKGKISIEDNGLQYDNSLYFSINKNDNINVLAINNADDNFLKKIFTEDEFNYTNIWRNVADYMADANSKGARVYAANRSQYGREEFDLKGQVFLSSLPTWRNHLMLASLEDRLHLLDDPAVRQALRNEVDQDTSLFKLQWGRTFVQRVKLAKNRGLEGKSIAELAQRQQKHTADAILDLAREEELDTIFLTVGTHADDESEMPEFVRSPYSITGVSDAGAHIGDFCSADFSTDFLGHWCRERGVVPLEEAVRRLTFMPAHLIGLLDRGLLRPGMAADITLFDPAAIAPHPAERISDQPGGGSRVIKRADGVRYVIVNGQILLEDARHTGAYPGTLIRNAKYIPR